MKDGTETDTDCGGPSCDKCADGKMCGEAGDCVSAMCANQICQSSCPAGKGECDGNASNGCEADLRSDSSNCGQCGTVCPPDKPACAVGVCVAPPMNPFFDSMPLKAGTLMRPKGEACGTQLTVTQNMTVSAVAVSLGIALQTHVKFMIWSQPGDKMVFVSQPKTFAAGAGWMRSDPFNPVTLQAGTIYDIGATADQAASYDYDMIAENANNIRTFLSTPYWSDYDKPAIVGRGGVDCGIQLFR